MIWLLPDVIKVKSSSAKPITCSLSVLQLFQVSLCCIVSTAILLTWSKLSWFFFFYWLIPKTKCCKQLPREFITLVVMSISAGSVLSEIYFISWWFSHVTLWSSNMTSNVVCVEITFHWRLVSHGDRLIGF